MGLAVGPQRPAELLAKECAKNDFKGIIKYVKYRGMAFLDVPFNLTNTFKILDKEFPDSKFILTIKDSPEDWYITNTSYHSKLFANGNLPTKSDLKKATYVYPGWMWEMNRLIYKTPEDDIYNKKILMQQYNDYNKSVIEYFKNKPGKLLVVNLAYKDALFRIRNFLNFN
ncbi:sulfotransferase [Eudoraea adriatica]|uniref:sulfotransferase n=1 Tax=Eudoraea adriatica TaxID=446681 RepID=UPI0014613C33|nr:sulfotransferase [Eudoraea adriatica]